MNVYIFNLYYRFQRKEKQEYWKCIYRKNKIDRNIETHVEFDNFVASVGVYGWCCVLKNLFRPFSNKLWLYNLNYILIRGVPLDIQGAWKFLVRRSWFFYTFCMWMRAILESSACHWSFVTLNKESINK